MQNDFNSDYSGAEELKDTEENLLNYSKSIVQKFHNFYSKNLQGSDLNVLEFGAGSGFLASFWENFEFEKPKCTEIDKNLIEELEAKGFVCEPSLEAFKIEFDFIYSSNVLEHIMDDIQALRDLRKHTREGGYLALYVPAHQFLFSDMDLKIGHYRRYGKKELISKVNSAGWVVRKCQWDDFLGVIALILLKSLGYKNKFGLGNPKSLRIYDLAVNPLSRILDMIGARFLIGKNILLFAQNPNDSSD
jgi:SAM-dependent methyltransferase